MNQSSFAGPLHAFLAGSGRDGQGRTVSDIISSSDRDLERVHDYIQWLFPLPTSSAAQPGAPVLTHAEIEALRADRTALETLDRATERMLRFYGTTRHWLTAYDHNHLRITRIIRSLNLLSGPGPARRFHEAVLAMNTAAGGPVNARSLGYWSDAADG